jgi:broad specificity phosphatase PhoE
VELWDYDVWSPDDFLGIALVRVGDLLETPSYFQVFGGRVQQHAASYPKTFDEAWLNGRMTEPSISETASGDGRGSLAPPTAKDKAWVKLRRCRQRGSGSPDTPGRENPIPSKTSMYFLRHGESEWNKAQANMDAYGMVSAVDHPLDSTGIAQCQEFNQRWKDAMKRCADSAGGEEGAGGDEIDAVALDEFLSADAVYASPLCRATQTCLIGLQGHPALTAEAPKPQVTLLSSAREVKKVGGMDTVGGFIGEDIIKNAKETSSAALTPQEAQRIFDHVEVDPYDTLDAWWTLAEDKDKENDMRARYYSFVSSLRFSARSGFSNKPTIVVGHSLFMREFCAFFMDPDLADRDPIAMRLTQQKLSNASMVKLDLEFDDANLEETVRIMGVTPMFDMQFHDKEDAVASRRGAGGLMDSLCCCLRKPPADSGEERAGATNYANPLDSSELDEDDLPSPKLRMSRRDMSRSASDMSGTSSAASD